MMYIIQYNDGYTSLYDEVQKNTMVYGYRDRVIAVWKIKEKRICFIPVDSEFKIEQ